MDRTARRRYAWTASAAVQPAKPDEVVIHFEQGVPSVHGDTGPALVAKLNALAGVHGIGRIDLVEDRVIGVKSREVYEAPAATVLIAAHKALERLVLTRDELRFKAAAIRNTPNLPTTDCGCRRCAMRSTRSTRRLLRG